MSHDQHMGLTCIFVCMLLMAYAVPSLSQQTVFNVPSGDVLDR